MAGRTKKRLSTETRKHLDALEDTLWRLEHGTPLNEVADAADYAFERAAHAAMSKGSEHGGGTRYARLLDWPKIIAENVRRLREEAGWTQIQLAQAMRKSGFSWGRVTVTEAENRIRRISLEELLALASLFAVPMATLFIPDDPDALWTQPSPGDDASPPASARPIDKNTLLAAMLGNTGRIGELSPTSAEPARIVGVGRPGSDTDWRPAKDLHERREQGYAR